MIRITSYCPLTNTTHVFEHSTLAKYTAWVERGYAKGYRSRRIDGDHPDNPTLIFTSNQPDELMVFTVRFVDD